MLKCLEVYDLMVNRLKLLQSMQHIYALAVRNNNTEHSSHVLTCVNERRVHYKTLEGCTRHICPELPRFFSFLEHLFTLQNSQIQIIT
jgi:hypothetical protein